MSATSPVLLVVDDSRTARMLIRGFVADLRPGWQIAEAASGDESLSVVIAQSPDFYFPYDTCLRSWITWACSMPHGSVGPDKILDAQSLVNVSLFLSQAAFSPYRIELAGWLQCGL